MPSCHESPNIRVMWTQVRFRLNDPAKEDDLTSELWLCGATGCEVRDNETFSEFDGSAFGGIPEGALEVVAYFPESAEPPPLAGITDRLPFARLLGAQPFDDTAWSVNWRQFFLPTRVSSRIIVRPSWDDRLPDDLPGEVLVIDPGMAFGTGTHETTRLCIRAIDEHTLAHPGCSFLDVGCGSGILSMAAVKLGSTPVFGVDNDPDAVRVACENWALNRLGAESAAPFSTVPLGDLTTGYDLVVANMLSGILLRLRESLIDVTASGGMLVLSGILESELSGFVDRFTTPPTVPPITIERQIVLNGWAAVWCLVGKRTA